MKEQKIKKKYIYRMLYNKSAYPAFKYLKSLTLKLRNIEIFENKRKNNILRQIFNIWKSYYNKKALLKKEVKIYESNKRNTNIRRIYNNWRYYIKSKLHYNNHILHYTFIHWFIYTNNKKMIMKLLV